MVWYGLMLYNFIIDFCGMTKLYLAMSCHSWSEMHLNHTFFLLWLFSSLNDLFFLHCNRYLWRKNSTVAWDECDSMEQLFNYHFCLSNLILHWVIFQLLVFLLRRWRGVYTPVFCHTFIQFSKTVKAVRSESTWILNLLANWKIEISSGFCNFYSCSRLFWTFQSSTYIRKCLLSFLAFQSHVATAFILEHSHLYFWYVYIFSLIITFSVFSVLSCNQVFSFSFHTHYLFWYLKVNF